MPITCESPRDAHRPIEFTSTRADYITAIYDAARAAGYDADWGRSGGGNLFYVDVHGISRERFSELLKEAGRKMEAKGN